MLEFLREQGLEQDTIVVYGTDHGEYACEFGLLEKVPGICSDAVTRIPFIWRVPWIPSAPHVCHHIVETVDLATTIAALAGLPDFTTGDGRDITPLLQGEDVEVHRVGVTENPWSKSIRAGAWRFVYYPDGMFGSETVGELYNLDEDPWETKNLFYEPAHRPTVSRLRDELLNWMVTKQRVRTAHPALGRRPGRDGKLPAGSHWNVVRQGQMNYL